MNLPDAPVDLAMAENRPAKQTVRSFWIEEVRTVATQHPDSDVPWYLTLSGADGRDIQLIIDEGLVEMTEVNSIGEKYLDKIVAIERNNIAIAALQRRFIGLRIQEVDFQNLIHGTSQFTWPKGNDINVCRARVVNLDLNAPLRAQQDTDGSIEFPVLEWIRKVCQIHGRQPRSDWTLCLTLHADIAWPSQVNEWLRTFLLENFQREPRFADRCRQFLGEGIIESITNNNEVDFTVLDGDDKQRFIMVVVPKLLAKLVHNDGWHVSTTRNLRYGGGTDEAPMVTWIVQFAWDGQATATPDALYRNALNEILNGAGLLTEDGTLVLNIQNQ